jgi:hypothetical protein
MNKRGAVILPTQNATSSMHQEGKSTYRSLNDHTYGHNQLDTHFQSQTKTRDTPGVHHVHRCDTKSELASRVYDYIMLF